MDFNVHPDFGQHSLERFSKDNSFHSFLKLNKKNFSSNLRAEHPVELILYQDRYKQIQDL